MAHVRFGFACISLQEEPTPGNSWVAKVIEHSGQSFVECSRKSMLFCKLVDHDFAMVEAIQNARSLKCTELMAAAADADEDPDVETEGGIQGPHLKKAKRSMIDEVDKVIEVTVRDEGGHEHTVKVVSAPYQRSPLIIEITDSNMTLLTKKPMAVEKWVPVINEANVQWCAYRKSLMCYHFDVTVGKWRKHVMKVKADFGDKISFQDAVHRLAKVVQEYYVQHHTQPDDE